MLIVVAHEANYHSNSYQFYLLLSSLLILDTRTLHMWFLSLCVKQLQLAVIVWLPC